MVEAMTKVTCDLTISLDGFSAGLNQSEARPFGDDGGDGWGSKLHAWIDDPAEEQRQLASLATCKAFIMGRNMFGPIRGDWDREWNGWWGDNPPYHAPVFVLTHHPRDPQPMDGGTTFHFVTDGIDAAFKLAREAAADGNISIHGGATTINQYLAKGVIDELRLRIMPITLGAGTRLFDGVPALNLEQVETRAGNGFTHITYRVHNA